MSNSKTFNFQAENDVFGALYDLRVADQGLAELQRAKGLPQDYLDPIIQASERSTGERGSLDENDLKRLKELGRCTHRKLLVILLEPTKISNSTIIWIDSVLRSASGNTLNKDNTAILNARALLPNASYDRRHKDSNATGQYNFRAVARSIKALKPDVIISCQCSAEAPPDSLVARLTKPMGEAGEEYRVNIPEHEGCAVISAFHPSVFTKELIELPRFEGLEERDCFKRLKDRSAVRKAALFEFCFLRAVNRAIGVEIEGDGIDKLKGWAL